MSDRFEMTMEKLLTLKREEATKEIENILREGHSEVLDVYLHDRDMDPCLYLVYCARAKGKEKLNEPLTDLMKKYKFDGDLQYFHELVMISCVCRIPYTSEFLDSFKNSDDYKKLDKSNRALVGRGIITFNEDGLTEEQKKELVSGK